MQLKEVDQELEASQARLGQLSVMEPGTLLYTVISSILPDVFTTVATNQRFIDGNLLPAYVTASRRRAKNDTSDMSLLLMLTLTFEEQSALRFKLSAGLQRTIASTKKDLMEHMLQRLVN